MLCTLEFLYELFPTYSGKLDCTKEVNEVMTDSRQVQGNSLFIPIIGERFNGHDFIKQAIENGAIAAIWDKEIAIPEDVPETMTFFLVEDTLQAMQLFAKAYRQSVQPIVIGITGSNGKTTTKDLVSAVVQQKYHTHATKGNFNNDIGLPLTILSMPRKTEVLILEMGMNHFHEIERLTYIAEPNYAIITNIGESHIEFLGSREGIAKAKLEIKEGLQQDGALIIDGDEALLDHVKQEEYVVSCGYSNNNDIVLSNIKLENQRTYFTYQQDTYHVPLLGKHHAKNACFAIWIAEKLGISKNEIQTGFNMLSYTEMRFEWLEGKNGVTLINDAYNASFTSMKASIDVLKQLQGFKRKIVVLGDILELGNFAKEMHHQIGNTITPPIDIVYTIGEEAKEIATTVKQKQNSIISCHFEDRDALISNLIKQVNKDTIILFKASRRMRLEEFVEACQ